MRDEAISSSRDPLIPPRSSSSPHRNLTPAASSAGASSPAVPANARGAELFVQGQISKGGSISRIGCQQTYTSLSNDAVCSAMGSSHSSCRPWERGDLLRRLSTFKPANWFGKPKAASSLACARRGWVNVDVDKIECESCGAALTFVSSSEWTPSEADGAGEIFSKRLDEGHKVTCPWIETCCSESLVQFPPTPPIALIGRYKDRCDELLQFPSLPIVAASAIQQIRDSRGPEIDRLLIQAQFPGSESDVKLDILLATENSRDDVFVVYSRSQKLISLCGWEPRWLPNVQDCEEQSAQSARNECSKGLSRYRGPPLDPGRGKKAFSSSRNKDLGKNEIVTPKPKIVSRAPLLDCNLCGATVRLWDFLSVSRPGCFAPNSNDVPETSKKTTLTRGISAASGIGGWVAADGTDKEQAGDHDVAATNDGKSLSNIGVDLNLTISAGLSSSQLQMNDTPEQYQDVHRKMDVFVRQPSCSEVGDRAASYESHGPSFRKRNLEEGGSTVDRDGDEVDDGRQYSTGPSKRARDSDFVDPHRYGKVLSGAGPSQSFNLDMGADATKDDPFYQEPDQATVYPIRDSTHASSVIAMDTIYHGADNDSMESVENRPGDFDDVDMPSTSTVKNTFLNETSELNYSNQAQQSTCRAAVRSSGEMGISSTNEEVVNADTATAHATDGPSFGISGGSVGMGASQEVVNADTATAHARDGPSFGISGGSVGMGASHEAEIHGTDASINRVDSVVGDIEPVAEITENQGQTGEFAPDPWLMGDFVPGEIDREDPHGDSQELISRSVGRADSGSKIVGSTKAESLESGEKTSNNTPCVNSPHPSLSCNAILCFGYEVSKEEVTQAAKDHATDDCGYAESSYMAINGIGPPNGESNFGEGVEFDPIKSHNPFCPWVNGNVAAAGCSSSGGSSLSAGALALCGWQLTLDALDAFQSQGQASAQAVESESAASMYKDDHQPPGWKPVARNSINISHGKD